MSERPPQALPNYHEQTLPSGLVIAQEYDVHNASKEHPHPVNMFNQPEEEAQRPFGEPTITQEDKTSNILSERETTLGGKPFIIVENTSGKPAEDENTPNAQPDRQHNTESAESPKSGPSLVRYENGTYAHSYHGSEGDTEVDLWKDERAVRSLNRKMTIYGQDREGNMVEYFIHGDNASVITPDGIEKSIQLDPDKRLTAFEFGKKWDVTGDGSLVIDKVRTVEVSLPPTAVKRLENAGQLRSAVNGHEDPFEHDMELVQQKRDADRSIGARVAQSTKEKTSAFSAEQYRRARAIGGVALKGVFSGIKNIARRAHEAIMDPYAPEKFVSAMFRPVVRAGEKIDKAASKVANSKTRKRTAKAAERVADFVDDNDPVDVLARRPYERVKAIASAVAAEKQRRADRRASRRYNAKYSNTAQGKHDRLRDLAVAKEELAARQQRGAEIVQLHPAEDDNERRAA